MNPQKLRQIIPHATTVDPLKSSAIFVYLYLISDVRQLQLLSNKSRAGIPPSRTDAAIQQKNGVSDRMLAKLCRRLHIPVPGRAERESTRESFASNPLP
jgi:hypothetical protein